MGECISISRIKKIGRRTNCTFNIIVLAALSISFSNYIHQKMEEPNADPSWIKNLKEMRSAVWVSLKPLKLRSAKIVWGNHLGCLIFPLPLQKEKTGLQKLEIVKQQVAKLLNS